MNKTGVNRTVQETAQYEFGWTESDDEKVEKARHENALLKYDMWFS